MKTYLKNSETFAGSAMDLASMIFLLLAVALPRPTVAEALPLAQYDLGLGLMDTRGMVGDSENGALPNGGVEVLSRSYMSSLGGQTVGQALVTNTTDLSPRADTMVAATLAANNSDSIRIFGSSILDYYIQITAVNSVDGAQLQAAIPIDMTAKLHTDGFADGGSTMFSSASLVLDRDHQALPNFDLSFTSYVACFACSSMVDEKIITQSIGLIPYTMLSVHLEATASAGVGDNGEIGGHSEAQAIADPIFQIDPAYAYRDLFTIKYSDNLASLSPGLTPVSAPVPEPETYAMLLAGLGLLGFTARQRKQEESAA